MPAADRRSALTDMTHLMNLIQSRESCRHYSAKQPERDSLLRCLEAAHLSPSACNTQPWHITLVCDDPAMVQATAECLRDETMNRFTEEVPAFAVISEIPVSLSQRVAAKFPNQTFSQIDIGLMTAHFCLKATEEGLSTCILGYMYEERLKKLLSLPDEWKPRIVIAIGYAAEEQLRPKKRKPLDEIADFR